MSDQTTTGKVIKSDMDWKRQLEPEQYRVTRLKATEPPFSGQYNDCTTPGTYHCICCGQALFGAAAKFDSKSGWPSFTQPLAPGAVANQADDSLGARRTEVLCSRCDAHLGHVFDDGPAPTGLRYCMNSVALHLKPDGEKS